MKGENVVVSTIGNFKGYQPADYYLPSVSSEKTGIRSRYSSAALARMSEARFMLVFAPISLAANYVSSHEKYQLNEVSERVKRGTEEFTQLELEGDAKFEVVVTPNKGTFSLENPVNGTVKVSTGSGNFYSSVYQTISEIFQKYEKCNVLVDTTHSLNHMTLDMVDATSLALRQLNASQTVPHKFNLRVYNSDPFIKNGLTPLQMNLIRTESISDRAESISKVVGDFFYNFDTNYYKRAIRKANLNSVIDSRKLNKLAYAFLLGAILVIGSYKKEVRSWKESTWNSMETSRNLLNKGSGITLKDGVVALGTELEREIPKIHAFAASISSEELYALDKETEIGKLKLAAKMLVEPGKTLLLDELNHLEKELAKQTLGKQAGKILMRELLKEKYMEDSETGKECKMDRRNFIAHAGLERNVTWVLLKNGKAFLSYDKCIESIFAGIGKKI